MSFRIDDILKKDIGPRGGETCSVPTKKYQSCEVLPIGDSILQQTLLSTRHHYAYCRSLSEPSYLKFYSDCNNWHNSDKVCPTSSCCNVYRERAVPYPYLRNRIWPSCPSSYPMMFYSQYSKRKGGQVRFTVSQTDALEKRFLSHKYLNPEDRRTLADTLKLTDRQVKTWFQNRRAKWRRSNSTSSIDTSEEKQEASESDEEYGRATQT